MDEISIHEPVQGNLYENEEKITGLINQMVLARRMEQKSYALLLQAERRHKIQVQNRQDVFARCKNELKAFCEAKGIPFDESQFN